MKFSISVIFLVSAVFLFAQEDEYYDADAVPPVENVHQVVGLLNIQKNIEADYLRALYATYQKIRQEEIQTLETLNNAYFEADTILAGRIYAEREDFVKSVLERIDSIEAKLVRQIAEIKQIRDRIAETRNRIAHYETKIAEILASKRAGPDDVSGTWLVSLMPLKITGEMQLFQNGIMVTGSYTLSGGWRGNVMGYVAGGKLILERYDAQLGHAGQFVLAVSSDGLNMTGRWQNYDLSIGPSGGQFDAKKLKHQ